MHNNLHFAILYFRPQRALKRDFSNYSYYIWWILLVFYRECREKNKLQFLGGYYKEVNTKEIKASQFNHLNGQYSKKKLSDRWNEELIKGKRVQRDLYSAFLIQNSMPIMKDKKEKWIVNTDACDKNFDNFLVLHDREIERLKENVGNKKILSSMGIYKGKVIENKITKPVIKDMFSMVNVNLSMLNKVKKIGHRRGKNKKKLENLMLF